jgi:hypothetical protein
LFGAHSGKNCRFLRDREQLLVARSFQFATTDCIRHFGLGGSAQPDLLRDRARREKVVPGNHLHRNAGVLTALHGRDRFRPRRIHHSLQTKKSQITRDVMMSEVALVGWGLSLGEREDSKTLCRHLVCGSEDFFGLNL